MYLLRVYVVHSSSVCSEAVHSTLPYVVAVYMVRDFLGTGADEQNVGRYTGALVSAEA